MTTTTHSSDIRQRIAALLDIDAATDAATTTDTRLQLPAILHAAVDIAVTELNAAPSLSALVTQLLRNDLRTIIGASPQDRPPTTDEIHTILNRPPGFRLPPALQHIEQAAHVLHYLRRRGWSQFTVRELHGALNRTRFPTARAVHDALETLSYYGYVARQPEPRHRPSRPGRPESPTYIVNPDLSPA
jgi:hypothetical protein